MEERNITAESVRASLDQDEIVMGKSVIEWAREANEIIKALVTKRYDPGSKDKFGAAVASVAMLVMIDSLVTTVPEEERFAVFVSVAKDMQMYILNGVSLDKFKVPEEFKDI